MHLNHLRSKITPEAYFRGYLDTGWSDPFLLGTLPETNFPFDSWETTFLLGKPTLDLKNNCSVQQHGGKEQIWQFLQTRIPPLHMHCVFVFFLHSWLLAMFSHHFRSIKLSFLALFWHDSHTIHHFLIWTLLHAFRILKFTDFHESWHILWHISIQPSKICFRLWHFHPNSRWCWRSNSNWIQICWMSCWYPFSSFEKFETSTFLKKHSCWTYVVPPVSPTKRPGKNWTAGLQFHRQNAKTLKRCHGFVRSPNLCTSSRLTCEASNPDTWKNNQHLQG